jgi:O-antigen/teichoic acid export membrane protein
VGDRPGPPDDYPRPDGARVGEPELRNARLLAASTPSPDPASSPSQFNGLSVRGIVSTAASNFGLYVLNNILATIVAIVVIRHLGRTEYGIMAFVVSYLSLFQILTSLGLDTIITRQVARRPAEASELVGGALGLRLALSITTILIADALCPLAGAHGRTVGLVALYSASFLFSMSPLYLVLFAVELRSRIPNAFFAIWSLLYVILRLGLVALGAGVAYFLAGDVVSGALTLVLGRWVSRRYSSLTPRPRVDWQLWGRLLWEAWPVGLATWLIALHSRIDQMLLFAYGGSHELGSYSVAVRISEVWIILATVFLTSVFPLLSRFAVDAQERMARTSYLAYRYLYAAIFPVGLALAFFSRDILRILFGGSFADAAPALTLLAGAEVFVFSNSVTYNVLFSMDAQRQAAVVAAGSLVLNALLNLWLIPRAGGAGAAAASLVSYGSVPLIAALLPSIRWLAFQALRTLWRPVLAAGLVGGMLAGLRPGPLAGLAVIGVLYPLALLATRALDGSDLRLLRRVLQ